MRNRNLIAMMYARLEKSSAEAEKAAQANASLMTPVDGCSCERHGQLSATDHHQRNNYAPISSALLPELKPTS